MRTWPSCVPGVRLALGSSRSRLLVYHRDGLLSVPLAEGKRQVIGRHPPADVPIRDSSLSRQHACVELVDGQVWVEDLGSTNGTWVNGQRVEQARLSTRTASSPLARSPRPSTWPPPRSCAPSAWRATTASARSSSARSAGPAAWGARWRSCCSAARRGARVTLAAGSAPCSNGSGRTTAPPCTATVPWSCSFPRSTRRRPPSWLTPSAGQGRCAADWRCCPTTPRSSGELFEVARRALQQASEAEPLRVAAAATPSSGLIRRAAARWYRARPCGLSSRPHVSSPRRRFRC